MSENEEIQKSSKVQSQDPNIPFLSSMEVGIRNYNVTGFGNRIQGWSINDEVVDLNESLSEELEKRLDDIDEGKEDLQRYSSADDYIKHLEEVLEE